MSLTQLFLLVANAYAQGAGVPLRVASWRALDASKTIPAVADGKASLTLASADRALAWFSANWPDGAVWPADVPRPPASEPDPTLNPQPSAVHENQRFEISGVPA